MSARALAYIVTAALVAAFTLSEAPAAFGHAVLRATDPATGTTQRAQPGQISFRFSEPVEARFGAIRIYDVKGRRVEAGEAFHPGADSSEIAERLEQGLPRGSYTATYRIISADGHPVSGGLVFSVGRPSATPGRTVSQLLAERGGVGRITKIGFGVARGAQYAAIALAIGAAFFLLGIWLPGLALVAGSTREWRDASEAFLQRLRAILIVTVLAGLISSFVGIVFQGATGAGVSFWSALEPRIWKEVLHTRFGTVWGLRALVWATLGAITMATFARSYRPVLRWASLGAIGLALSRPLRIPALMTAAMPLFFLAFSVTLAGHASLQHPTAVLIPANVVHVLSVSVWAGGLALLVAALPAATRRLEPSERPRLIAAIITRFSTVAAVAVALILAGGLAQSLVEVRSLDNLTGTAFGRAVLIKICLFTGLLAIGAFNRRRMLPKLKMIAARGEPTGHTGLVLRRALRLEVALITAVLGVTAALVSYAPSVAVTGGPVSMTRSLGPADLQLTVDPARVGPNAVHFYLTDKRTGSQYTAVKEFKADVALPEKRIGPIAQSTHKAGPGHYVMDGAVFGARGDWQVRISARVSEFDAYYATLEVPIK